MQFIRQPRHIIPFDTNSFFYDQRCNLFFYKDSSYFVPSNINYMSNRIYSILLSIFLRSNLSRYCSARKFDNLDNLVLLHNTSIQTLFKHPKNCFGFYSRFAPNIISIKLSNQMDFARSYSIFHVALYFSRCIVFFTDLNYRLQNKAAMICIGISVIYYQIFLCLI